MCATDSFICVTLTHAYVCHWLISMRDFDSFICVTFTHSYVWRWLIYMLRFFLILIYMRRSLFMSLLSSIRRYIGLLCMSLSYISFHRLCSTRKNQRRCVGLFCRSLFMSLLSSIRRYIGLLCMSLSHLSFHMSSNPLWWRRCVGCLKLQVSFRKRATN